MLRSQYAMALVALFMAVAQSASAQATPHVLTNLPLPAPELTTGVFFPSQSDKKFPAGKLVR
jgi:hypothetical protein